MDRIVGPSEYAALRKQYGVSPANFDQYFTRSTQGISVKSQYDPKAQGQSPLANTLPPEQKSLPVTSPAGSVDQLTALKLAMQNMSQLALKQGLAGGTNALLGGLDAQGLGPSHVPGSLVGNIINFVENSVKNPIQDEFSKMNSIIDSVASQKKDAQDQISTMIGNGMWGQLDPSQRQAIWGAAGYAGQPTTVGKTAFEHSTDADGHVWNIQYDTTTGDIISKKDFGPVGKGFKNTGPSGDAGLTADEANQKFRTDLANPKGIGLSGVIAVNDKQLNEAKLQGGEVHTREELINKLFAQWGNYFSQQDIANAVYSTYPG